MVKQTDDVTQFILRDIQSNVARLGRDMSSMNDDMRIMRVRLDELVESSAMALGLAGHANLRHDTVQKQIADLTKRVERLETPQ